MSFVTRDAAQETAAYDGEAAALAAALDIATMWSYINRPDETLALLDRLGGLLHGLIHGTGKAA